jgi:hypothetical protein
MNLMGSLVQSYGEEGTNNVFWFILYVQEILARGFIVRDKSRSLPATRRLVLLELRLLLVEYTTRSKNNVVLYRRTVERQNGQASTWA